MKKDAAKKIVDAHIKQLMWATQTQMWTVNIIYGPCNNSWALAQVQISIDYFLADITINHAKHETEDQVLNSLRHELLHLVLAPFELYHEAMSETFKDDPKLMGIHKRLMTHACESMVHNLEHIFQHGVDPRSQV